MIKTLDDKFYEGEGAGRGDSLPGPSPGSAPAPHMEKESDIHPEEIKYGSDSLRHLQ